MQSSWIVNNTNTNKTCCISFALDISLKHGFTLNLFPHKDSKVLQEIIKTIYTLNLIGDVYCCVDEVCQIIWYQILLWQNLLHPWDRRGYVSGKFLTVPAAHLCSFPALWFCLFPQFLTLSTQGMHKQMVNDLWSLKFVKFSQKRTLTRVIFLLSSVSPSSQKFCLYVILQITCNPVFPAACH